MGIALVEPAIVPDTYVSGLYDVEDLGDGTFRFTFFAKQRSVHDGKEERVVVARIVIGASAILHAAKWALSAIGMRCYCAALHLVK
jgi:hypothetical protein